MLLYTLSCVVIYFNNMFVSKGKSNCWARVSARRRKCHSTYAHPAARESPCAPHWLGFSWCWLAVTHSVSFHFHTLAGECFFWVSFIMWQGYRKSILIYFQITYHLKCTNTTTHIHTHTLIHIRSLVFCNGYFYGVA